MNILELKKYAKGNGGYDTGRFICVKEGGVFEFKWLDAYFGFLWILQPRIDTKGFITVEVLREMFGDDQLYLPTIGYSDDE